MRATLLFVSLTVVAMVSLSIESKHANPNKRLNKRKGESEADTQLRSPVEMVSKAGKRSSPLVEKRGGDDDSYNYYFAMSRSEMVTTLASELRKIHACHNCTDAQKQQQTDDLLELARDQAGESIVEDALEKAQDPDFNPSPEDDSESRQLGVALAVHMSKNNDMFEFLVEIEKCLTEFEEEAAELDEQISQLVKKVADNEDKLGARQASIASLSAEVADLEEQLNSYEGMCSPPEIK